MQSKMWVVHLRTILILVISVALTVLSVWAVSAASSDGYSAEKLGYTVVIDAGHGGFDNGVSGVNGTKESEINLIISRKVTHLLRTAGVTVTETRTDSNGLYGTATSDRKIKDMNKRKEIIENAKPDAVVSIHMNAFPQSKQRGAQVFYQNGRENGEALAKTLQNALSRNIEYCDRIVLAADYFVLNCTGYPSALVECGFLSNADDERLLNTGEYQEKISYYIYSGIMYFLYNSK